VACGFVIDQLEERAGDDDSGQHQGCTLQAAATRVTDPAALRFAVAAFDTWADAHKVAQELCSGSNPLSGISYLGLRDVLSEDRAQPLSDLAFPGNAAPVVCSTGPVAERLAARLDAGMPSLQAALAAWLIPRHAAQLQRTVDNGKIVLWVQLADHADEQRAYRTLMAANCTSVGVHDLVGG
jgi:hypothetical protein